MSTGILAFPSIEAIRETTENVVAWGRFEHLLIGSGSIAGTTRDSGNTPTTVLRPGLVLAKTANAGEYTHYDATAANPQDEAVAILFYPLRAQDFDGNDQQRFAPVLFGGPVKAGNLFGLDAQARTQLRRQGFKFDDLDIGEDEFSTPVTATVGGGTTGLIPAFASFVQVTSDSAAKQISLPAASPGKIIRIQVGATGCELISAVATHKANDVVIGATNELALDADSHFICEYIATNEWIVRGFTALGADKAALVPDAL